MSDEVARVHYFDDQFLSAQDFADEQAYHVAMRRRHNVAHHTWGVVVGLDLTVDADGVASVGPGLAVDGLGREVVLGDRRVLDAQAAFTDKATATLEVWIEYDREPAEAAGDDCPDVAGPADAFYRWRERPLLTLQAPDFDYPDPRVPKGVSAADLAYTAAQTPPDDPAAHPFPIYLGKLSRGAKAGDPPIADLTGRPYVGLVAAEIAAASGTALVRIGTQDDDAAHRFAVYVLDPATGAPAGGPTLALLGDGTVQVDAQTTVAGDLTMDGGGVQLAGGGEARADRAPWRIYRTHDPDADSDELRLEMARGTGSGRNRIAIGTFGDTTDANGVKVKAFRPCLTVYDDCSVRVAGDLIVGGRVRSGGESELRLSDRLRDFMASGFMSGMAGSSGLVPGLFGGGAEPVPMMLARNIQANPEHVEELARVLREHDPGMADRLRGALAGDEEP